MENYIQSLYRASHRPITENDTGKLSALFAHDRGIENFRISPDGIYLEYNTYLYSAGQLEKMLDDQGFGETKARRPGFLSRQIRYLAESNKTTYGDHKPDCCH
ncbi:MAG: hypothetical protein ACWGNV_00910 [Bacteroidales bacterium]